jgi:hypothetical protein
MNPITGMDAVPVYEDNDDSSAISELYHQRI